MRLVNIDVWIRLLFQSCVVFVVLVAEQPGLFWHSVD